MNFSFPVFNFTFGNFTSYNITSGNAAIYTSLIFFVVVSVYIHILIFNMQHTNPLQNSSGEKNVKSDSDVISTKGEFLQFANNLTLEIKNRQKKKQSLKKYTVEYLHIQGINNTDEYSATHLLKYLIAEAIISGLSVDKICRIGNGYKPGNNFIECGDTSTNKHGRKISGYHYCQELNVTFKSWTTMNMMLYIIRICYALNYKFTVVFKNKSKRNCYECTTITNTQ